VPLEGASSEIGRPGNFDESTPPEVLQTVRIVALPAKNVDIKLVDGGQVRKYGAPARRTQLPALEGLAAYRSSHT
jgi:hypothetical protein